MKNKKNKSNKNKSSQREDQPRRKEVEEISSSKLPNVDRHVDEIIRKYNDFAIIDQD